MISTSCLPTAAISCSSNIPTVEHKSLRLSSSPVITHVEGIKALGEALHVGGADSLQEVDVVLGVEAAHVMLRSLVRLEDLEMET